MSAPRPRARRGAVTVVTGAMLLALAACGPALPEAPAPRSPATAAPAQAPPLLAGDVARRVHRATNQARQARGRRALRWSDRLVPLARAHSADMARRGFFDHVNPNGEAPSDRAARLGVSCRRDLGGGRIRAGVSENLYQTWRWSGWTETTRAGRTTRTYDWQTADEIARVTVEGWLGSPGHRRNLLDADAQAEAVAVAIAGTGEVYVTQVLC